MPRRHRRHCAVVTKNRNIAYKYLRYLRRSVSNMVNPIDPLLEPHITAKEVCWLRVQSLLELSKGVDNPACAAEFKARLQDLPSLREKYEKSVSVIYAANKRQDPSYVPSYSEITSFDDMYYQIRSVADGLSVQTNEKKCSGAKPKLPKLEIFPFDSNLDSWSTFRDTFSSLVHNNTDIGNIEKFYYLLSSVSGAALSIVKSLPVTADNYPLVWNSLVKRYDNKRALATYYLDKLFGFKPLQNESAAGLNTFLQTYQESVNALKNLHISDLSSFMLFYMSIRNLDGTTRREFEQTKKPGEIPTYEEIMTFVDHHVRVLEMSDSTLATGKATVNPKTTQFKVTTPTAPKATSPPQRYANKAKTFLAASASATEDQPCKYSECVICKKSHSIYRCEVFKDLSPEQRLDKVRQLNLCENCLKTHKDNSTCPSKFSCTVCKSRHHHMVHIDNLKPNCSQIPSGKPDPSIALTCSSNSTVLLGTAIIHVADSWGQYQPVRCIIDSGAMTSYITQDCAKRLGLTRRKCNFETVGLGGKSVQNHGLATCSIKPRDRSGPVLSTDAVIVTNIAGNLPTMPLSNEIKHKYRNLLLADPLFYKPAPIDMLLAADLFPYIYDGQKVDPHEKGMPVAMNSIFGYVISGQTVLDKSADNASFCAFSMNLDQVIQSFWEVENIPSDRPKNPDDVMAEELFAKEHSRDDTGKFTVKYPFGPSCELGESRLQAERRLNNLESKLERDSELKTEYHKFMQEYQDLGHMTRVGEIQDVDSKYIIPHFCILKPSSTTTKLRVVFDASSKTSNSESLNSIVLPGPKLQADLNQILINFRLFQVCLTSDICKMYRMIELEGSQRPYQHILWRSSPDQPIQVFELNTVTYGVASSPYLAIKVLHTLAEDEMMRFPRAAEVLKKAFFMDDFLWSVDTIEEAVSLQEELIALLNSGGFMLRKWASNRSQVLQQLPEEHRETPIQFDDDKNLSIKVLGLQWLPANDSFSFTTSPTNAVVSKRTVLSQIGRLFDPLGYVAPCIFYAKCFMQKLWAQHLDWDQSLPADLEAQWQTYVKELPLLSQVQHDRHAMIPQHTNCQILGFCDASSLGIASTVYLRTVNRAGDCKVSLLIAKSKVAPLNTVSIPRLELMGAHLLAKLVQYVKSILQDRLHINETLLFTDSSVVLAWLNTPSYTLKTFVANRVAKIVDNVPTECWYHVSGACNPADVCSRGALPSALLGMPEWLNGPEWLSAERCEWPIRTIDEFRDDNPPELKTPKLVLLTTNDCRTNELFDLTEKFSSFNKLVNIVGRCFQFLHNCRVAKSKRRGLSVGDLRKSHDILIKTVQKHHFSADITALSKGEQCHQSLRKLNPFMDSNCFLRVGGRLSQSDLTFEKKHPLLLPKKSNFTNILIDHYHKLHLHVGPRTLQSLISQKYWIISSRGAIRSRTIKCIACFKVSPSTRQPFMGELPKFRSQDIHVFHTVGIDIGGPFYTKESNRRNARLTKAYLCVFVCCATRAVHLEVLSSLSTECFLACFDRFTARRGLCNTILSDNATNFVSAGKQLAEVSRFLNSESNNLSREFVARKVQWKHNPPTGSHFGGIYEAAIKSAKLHLKRVVGTRALSFEELSTLFARVEAVLNSRPLCALSNDPNEFEVLTPSHFLIGRELLSVPEYDLMNLSNNRLNRWQAVQQVSQQFWRRWKQDYLHTLQQRQKWFKHGRDLKIGDLVLINSDSPPLQWNLARVTKLHPGPDSVVRVVGVRTKHSEFTRPVVKLSPLPLEQDSS